MGGRCLADNPPLGLVVFQFYGKVGTEKTKSQGGIFMHMADALVTPAVAGTAELEADGDAYETAAAVYQKFWGSGIYM